MNYDVYLNRRMQQYEIDECSTGTWDSLLVAQRICDELNAKLIAQRNHIETAEETHQLALAGIPSEKSLKNISAKLAAIKRAEEIENSDE